MILRLAQEEEADDFFTTSEKRDAMTVVMKPQPDVESAVLPTPVVYLPNPPPDAASFSRYRGAVATLLDEPDIAGVVVVSAHWLREGASPNVVLHVDLNGAAVTDETVILAEAVAARLESAGLSVDLEEAHDTGGGPEALAAFEPQRLPVLHVSVPINFGPDLMMFVGAALAKLRERGVLLAACAESPDASSLASLAPRELRRAREWVQGQAASRYRDIYPLLFMIAAAFEDDRLYDWSPLTHAGVVVGLRAGLELQSMSETRRPKALKQGPRHAGAPPHDSVARRNAFV